MVRGSESRVLKLRIFYCCSSVNMPYFFRAVISAKRILLRPGLTTTIVSRRRRQRNCWVSKFCHGYLTVCKGVFINYSSAFNLFLIYYICKKRDWSLKALTPTYACVTAKMKKQVMKQVVKKSDGAMYCLCPSAYVTFVDNFPWD